MAKFTHEKVDPQNKHQGIRERHTKEDKKKYKKGRKLRQKQRQNAKQLQQPVSAQPVVVPTLPKAASHSRGHTIVKMAVKNNRLSRSTFLTSNIRSCILPRSLRSTQSRTALHQPKTTPPELNRSLLSSPAEKVLLGEGTYGVTSFMYFNGNLPVAVKEFKMNNIYEIKKEAGVISDLQQQHHPNLPFILGVCVKERPYLMVTQFYGKAKKSFPLNKATERGVIQFVDIEKVFKQIVDAIHCVHEAGWLHNDIKANNVLVHPTPLESTWKPVVIDFGKTRSRNNPKKYELTETQKQLFKNKHPWIAPELVEGTHTQSPESDLFSLGFLLQGVLGKFVRRNYSLESVSTKCLARYPQTRMSIKQLLDEL